MVLAAIELKVISSTASVTLPEKTVKAGSDVDVQWQGTGNDSDSTGFTRRMSTRRRRTITSSPVRPQLGNAEGASSAG